jgi:hypothetical protein
MASGAPDSEGRFIVVARAFMAFFWAIESSS